MKLLIFAIVFIFLVGIFSKTIAYVFSFIVIAVFARYIFCGDKKHKNEGFRDYV